MQSKNQMKNYLKKIHMLVIQNYPILYLIKLINTIKFMAENPLRTRFLKLSTIENRDAKIWEDEENFFRLCCKKDQY